MSSHTHKVILVVTPTFFPTMGGAERGIYEIFRRLSQHHHVHILAPEPTRLSPNYWPQGLESASFTVHRYKDHLNLLKTKGQRLLMGALPPFSFSMAQAAKDLVRRLQPHVANVHYAIPSGFTVYMLREHKVPVVLSLVGRDIPDNTTLPLWPAYVRWVMNWSTKTIFISKYSRTSLLGRENLSDTSEIIPYGVSNPPPISPYDLAKLRKKLEISEASFVLFALQRLEKVKRVDVLLHTLALVYQVRKDIVLVIGGSGAESTSLKQLADDLGLSQQIRFVGFIPESDLPYYFGISDLFVFHSTSETFGVAVAEAMIAQKPIIAADETAVAELISHQHTGWLTASMNPALLAEGILTLLNHPDLRSKLATMAFQYAHNYLNWDKIAERYDEVLSKAST